MNHPVDERVEESGIEALACACHFVYIYVRFLPREVNKLSVCLSVCPSVRPSVTLVHCDHTRRNSAKITKRLISLGTWLSADTNITDVLQREHP